MKRIISSLCAMACLVTAAAAKSVSADKGISCVTSVARIFGDGEKVDSVIVSYKKAIDPQSVSADDYEVEGRRIASASVSGKDVTLQLVYENKWDASGGQMQMRGGGRRPDGEDKAGGGRPGEGQGAGPRFDSEGSPVDLSCTVRQLGEVAAHNGTVYTAGSAIRNTRVREPELERFQKKSFTDSGTGITLPYFVYLPDGYSKKERYPLVFFVPDASADTNIDTATLTQGNGAIVWASEEEQAKHKAIVVAVQYPLQAVREHGALTDDSYTWTDGLSAVYKLLQHLLATYSVDTSRIYGTGQSQGCMTNIALSDRYPDLFAAQFLVAGQWNVEEMAAMKDKKLWIVVCEGDGKAYPEMSAAVGLWESLGASVARGDSFWKQQRTEAEKQADTDAMRAKGADIMFNVIEGGSHMYTWSVAYDIAGIRDWLFEQQSR